MSRRPGCSRCGETARATDTDFVTLSPGWARVRVELGRSEGVSVGPLVLDVRLYCPRCVGLLVSPERP